MNDALRERVLAFVKESRALINELFKPAKELIDFINILREST